MKQETTLAAIAYALRYYNMTDEEDAQIPAPWNYQNIPQAVRTERHIRLKVGRNPEKLTYCENVEHFADGSSFAFATAN